MTISHAQLGGNNVYQFLNFTQSARVQSAGGYLISVRDGDANLGQENPALLNRDQHGWVNLNYVNYFADSDAGYASYTKHYADVGTFNASLQYANYGKFQYATVGGDRDGSTFSANDVALRIGYGRPLDSLWSVGAAINLIGSFYEQYTSYGLAFNLGVNYYKVSSGFGFGVVMRNAGLQLTTYNSVREKLPFDIAIGISKRLEHAPFRFSLTYDNLTRWKIIYFDDTQTASLDPLTGDLIEIKPPGFVSQFLHHLTLGTELILSKNLYLNFGYQHRTRQFNTPAARGGLTGFSFGVGFKVKKLHFNYALYKNHRAGTANHFTISRKIGKPAPQDDFLYRQF